MYCSSCGKEVLPGTAHCPNCGVQISNEPEPVPKQNETVYPQAGGGLDIVKGLAALLGGALAGACGLSAAGCTAIRLLSALNRMLVGGLLGAVFGGLYSLLFLGFLFGMLFLLWSAVTRAMAIHREEAPRPILFFEQAAILKDQKEAF